MTQENTTQQDNFKRIEAYSLMDFAVELEKAFLEGYRLSITNDNFPTNFGTLYTAGMVLSDTNTNTNTKAGMVKYQPEVASDEVKVVEDGSEQVKRGRKPKVD